MIIEMKILKLLKTRKIISLSLLLILAICIISLLLEFYSSTQDESLAGLIEIIRDAPCEASFFDTMEGNQTKIESYNFSQAEPYFRRPRPYETLKAIFKENTAGYVEIPVLVGAASSNHFHEALGLIKNLNELVRPAYPTTKFYFYDLGLKANEARQIREVCNCEVITFPFDRFPPHVRHLFAYCWKPLAIEMILQTYRFVMWMDTSVRFKTSELDSLFIQAKQQGVMSKHDIHLLPSHVHEDTFKFLQEPPCLYRNLSEFQGGLLLFHSDNKVTYNYIFTPWVKCALIEECMKTKHPTGGRLLYCKSHTKYHSCHRYDQAVLSLLLYRMFPDSYMSHHIDTKYNHFGY